MRRRLRWMIPAAIAVIAISAALWPADDGNDFLRALGPMRVESGALKMLPKDDQRLAQRMTWFIFDKSKEPRLLQTVREVARARHMDVVDDSKGSLVIASMKPYIFYDCLRQDRDERYPDPLGEVHSGEWIVSVARRDNWLEGVIDAVRRFLRFR